MINLPKSWYNQLYSLTQIDVNKLEKHVLAFPWLFLFMSGVTFPLVKHKSCVWICSVNGVQVTVIPCKQKMFWNRRKKCIRIEWLVVSIKNLIQDMWPAAISWYSRRQLCPGRGEGGGRSEGLWLLTVRVPYILLLNSQSRYSTHLQHLSSE